MVRAAFLLISQCRVCLIVEVKTWVFSSRRRDDFMQDWGCLMIRLDLSPPRCFPTSVIVHISVYCTVGERIKEGGPK